VNDWILDQPAEYAMSSSLGAPFVGARRCRRYRFGRALTQPWASAWSFDSRETSMRARSTWRVCSGMRP
jgi:hypothetical protein